MEAVDDDKNTPLLGRLFQKSGELPLQLIVALGYDGLEIKFFVQVIHETTKGVVLVSGLTAAADAMPEDELRPSSGEAIAVGLYLMLHPPISHKGTLPHTANTSDDHRKRLPVKRWVVAVLIDDLLKISILTVHKVGRRSTSSTKCPVKRFLEHANIECVRLQKRSRVVRTRQGWQRRLVEAIATGHLVQCLEKSRARDRPESVVVVQL
jgi:hypothetical protein